MEKDSIIHIVMTPVRNEAWVLRAFLTATSQWADYIIIADQMSTDGSRDIYREFVESRESRVERRESGVESQKSRDESRHRCELIVIDNTNPEFNEAERQAMLVAKAREVAAGRDTLLWGLDADEILAANAFETEDWKRILQSNKGDVFRFRWAMILEDEKSYYNEGTFFPWLFHDNGIEPHGNYVRNMHSMRIPYPTNEHVYDVNDFFVLHLDRVNPYRRISKNRFYTFVDWQLNNKSFVSLARMYYPHRITQIKDVLDSRMIAFSFDSSIWELINTRQPIIWMDEYVKDRINFDNLKKTKWLRIWDKNFINFCFSKDPRGIFVVLFHKYIEITDEYRYSFCIRCFDKIIDYLI